MTKAGVGWLWLLSGVPAGLALLVMPPVARLYCFAFFILLETGHSLSPIVLAWTHGEFRRQVIYAQPRKFLLWPSLAFAAAVAVGIITQAGWTSYNPVPGAFGRITDLSNPLPLLVWFYSAWNLYHFAMQDWGVLMLCSGSAHRHVKKWACLILLFALNLAVSGINLLGFWRAPPLVDAWWIGFAMTGFISVNHWTVDIGLSSCVARHGLVFIIGVLLAGAIGIVWMVPTPGGMLIRMVPAIICARLGLGLVHFLYSRWVWQFSNPKVRATIGRDLGLA